MTGRGAEDGGTRLGIGESGGRETGEGFAAAWVVPFAQRVSNLVAHLWRRIVNQTGERRSECVRVSFAQTDRVLPHSAVRIGERLFNQRRFQRAQSIKSAERL